MTISKYEANHKCRGTKGFSFAFSLEQAGLAARTNNDGFLLPAADKFSTPNDFMKKRIDTASQP